MPDSTIEIINGRECRRRWGVEEKLRIVAASHEPGATVGDVTARHDVYPSLLRVAPSGTRRVSGRGAGAALRAGAPDRSAIADVGHCGNGEPSRKRHNRNRLARLQPRRVGSGVNLTALRRVVTALRG